MSWYGGCSTAGDSDQTANQPFPFGYGVPSVPGNIKTTSHCSTRYTLDKSTPAQSGYWTLCHGHSVEHSRFSVPAFIPGQNITSVQSLACNHECASSRLIYPRLFYQWCCWSPRSCEILSSQDRQLRITTGENGVAISVRMENSNREV